MRISDLSSDVCSSDLHDARCSSLGQIDVDAASEPNETDSLPPCHHISGLHKGHNPSGDQAGYLRETDSHPVAAFDQYMLSLIVFARLIQISVQELASDINDRLDGSTNRGDRKSTRLNSSH